MKIDLLEEFMFIRMFKISRDNEHKTVYKRDVIKI